MYDASTDPEDHLSVFLTHMRLQTTADEVRCKTFPMFLKGKARLWFQGLKPGSIRSFPELARQFAAQFVSSKVYARNATHLMSIRQRPDESLRNFMTRFNAESLQGRGALLRPGQEASVNLEELLRRAHEAANAEEAGRLKKESDRELGDRKDRKTPQRQGSRQEKRLRPALEGEDPCSATTPREDLHPSNTAQNPDLGGYEAEGLGDRPPKMGKPGTKGTRKGTAPFTATRARHGGMLGPA
nr:uncharacterized protein LOC113714043 [Coffea arabica]